MIRGCCGQRVLYTSLGIRIAVIILLLVNQFHGTLFFNVTIYQALHTSLSDSNYDRLVWRPGAFGSICFQVLRHDRLSRFAAARLAARARPGGLAGTGGQPACLRPSGSRRSRATSFGRPGRY